MSAAPPPGARLAAVIAEGAIAVIPTDTVYGVCCDAQNAAAAKRLADLKGRSSGKPAAVAFFALEPEISRHEPRHALDGGRSGLEPLARLIEQASATAAATLILEHGQGQEHDVATLCRAGGYPHITHHRDLAQTVRALRAGR